MHPAFQFPRYGSRGGVLPPPPTVVWRRFVEGEEEGEFGEKTVSWVDTPIQAAFAPTSTSEPETGTMTHVVSQAQLFLREPIDYTARDEFLINGERWTAEGDGGTWWGMYSNRFFGQQILLKRVSG